MIGDRTRTIVIGVVTAVWASNFLAGVVLPSYEPSESINGIFMAIVGGLFALGARSGDDKKNRPDEDEEDEPKPKPKPKAKKPGAGS